MNGFLLALQFLSIITIRPGLMAGPGALARARVWFGLVGVILGGLLALAAYVLDPFLPPLVLAAVLTLLWAGLSRCLHLDGLADTADALVHTTTRERALEIMKDTHLGSFGLAAVSCLLLVKFAALASLNADELWRGVWLAAPLGRAAAAGLSALLPPARLNVGLGAMSSGEGWAAALFVPALTALIMVMLLAGPAGLWVMLGVLLLALLLGWCFWRRIRGVTGDNLGAAIELCEALALVIYCGLGS